MLQREFGFSPTSSPSYGQPDHKISVFYDFPQMVWFLAADYESVVAAIIYRKMLSETLLRNPLENIKNLILNPYVNETG